MILIFLAIIVIAIIFLKARLEHLRIHYLQIYFSLMYNREVYRVVCCLRFFNLLLYKIVPLYITHLTIYCDASCTEFYHMLYV